MASDRRRHVATAGKWLLALSVLFAVFGTIMGFMAQEDADKAQAVLARLAPDEVFTVEGETKPVAEWSQQIDLEVKLVFILNYGLAVVFLGLFFWGRTAPLPAMITGLCIYLVVQVGNAVVDPETIVQGILIKILFVVAMISGIKAAVADQAARRRQALA